MTYLWTWRGIDASDAVAWDLLTDTTRWPEWGPTVRSVELDGDALHAGARGTVTTVAGLNLPFEITVFEPPGRWAWRVAGLPATDHRVEPEGEERCRVGFGVPVAAAPYLAVCRIATARLAQLAVDTTATS